MRPGRFVLSALRGGEFALVGSAPGVLVLENPNHARAFAAGVFLHLHEHRKPLRQCGARGTFVVEHQDLAVVTAYIAPDAGIVLDFDLELHVEFS